MHTNSQIVKENVTLATCVCVCVSLSMVSLALSKSNCPRLLNMQSRWIHCFKKSCLTLNNDIDTRQQLLLLHCVAVSIFKLKLHVCCTHCLRLECCCHTASVMIRNLLSRKHRMCNILVLVIRFMCYKTVYWSISSNDINNNNTINSSALWFFDTVL